MATIEITKAEAKEAGVFKSEMYENLKELDRRDGIPDYYDTMYLDGYDVNQICRAFDRVQRKKFRKIRQEKMAKREQQELERSIKAELVKSVKSVFFIVITLPKHFF